ncbi:TrmB family transcriptional regulator [Natrialbaceae archaeon A-CW2]|uniref:TrmB family transcriptional regulator n=1 Tax=Natronosalvus amylolyticus TaxID=2961994 RepID=UPI0020C9AA01|nr:TrmB family transcriptional regulator sugar-binding domain-containing protein [Natronosalvus amylolyticus]
MDDSTLSDRLRQLGLSEKEVDTYLTILEHGEAKASTVADDAGVSKRYVYSVSEKLDERGFVDVIDHAVPTTIRANPPDEVIAALTTDLESLEPELKNRYGNVSEQEREFEVIKTRTTIMKRITQLLERAEEEVTLSVPAALLEEIEDALEATVDRGVMVILLVTGDDSLPESRFSGLASIARSWGENAPLIVTADQHLGLFAPNEMLVRSNSGKQGIAISQAQLVPIIVGSFFGNYWPMAEQVYVTEPDVLPRTYTDFRHGVLQSTLHLEAGHDILVRAEARPVRTDEYATIEGQLVGVRQSLLEPTRDTFAVENALILELESEDDEDTIVTVGGKGAFVEDYEANSVTLERV